MKDQKLTIESSMIFASDFDGTLYFWDPMDPFKEADLEAIRKFQDRKGLFGVCTGRSLDGVLAITKGAIKFDFYILATGALILDRSLNVIYEENIPHECVNDIVEDIRNQADCMVMTDLEAYVLYREKNIPVFSKAFNNVSELLDKKICGISINTENRNDAERLCGEINQKYGDRITAFQNATSVDIAPLGCSKGNAIDILKKGYDHKLICGIGDSFNDIPLLSEADLAFTFNDAPDEVKKKAAYYVSSVGEALELMMQLYMKM